MDCFQKMNKYLLARVKLIEGLLEENASQSGIISFHQTLHAQIIGDPMQGDFLRLSKECEKSGVFDDVLPFDGREHSYIEIGGWLGDQGAALRYMALAAHFGLARLMTPDNMFGQTAPQDIANGLFATGHCTMTGKNVTPCVRQHFRNSIP